MSKDFPLLPGEQVRRMVITIPNGLFSLLSGDQQHGLYYRLLQLGRVDRDSEGIQVRLFHRIKAYEVMSILMELYQVVRHAHNEKSDESAIYTDYNDVLLGGLSLSIRQRGEEVPPDTSPLQ